MQYGICHLSIVPVRSVPDHNSEMITQLLYGDHFKIREQRKKWSRVKIGFDGTEGWVANHQFIKIEEDNFKKIDTKSEKKFVADLVSHIATENNVLIPIVLGSRIDTTMFLSHIFEGEFSENKKNKSGIVDTALLYLNAPHLKGGKTPFGIDCSGFTHMVYRINGYHLERETEKQALQGEALSFIEESEPGDLAFFDNEEGIINHVGIILEDNYIIHTHGHVRIDRLDHTGIFNIERKIYSHKLRVIKKIA